MTFPGEQVRAIFFSMLMITSMIAGVATITGAADENPSSDINLTDTGLNETGSAEASGPSGTDSSNQNKDTETKKENSNETSQIEEAEPDDDVSGSANDTPKDTPGNTTEETPKDTSENTTEETPKDTPGNTTEETPTESNTGANQKATSTPTFGANVSEAVRKKVDGGLLVDIKSSSDGDKPEAAVASASGGGTEFVAVVVYTEMKLSNTRISELQASGIQIDQESWIPDKSSDGGSYYARVPENELSVLAQVPSIQRIDPGDAELTLDDSVPMTNATDVHSNSVGGPSASTNRSLTGQNVRVAVIDTGIDDSHPAIQGQVVAGEDYVGDGNTYDEDGHGTHVAATIVSDNDTHTGVAPDAKLIDLDIGDSGNSLNGDIGQAITDAATQYNADVISMSLGRTGGLSSHRTGTGRLDSAVRQARANGAVVIVSSGNARDDSTHARDTVPGQSSVWVDLESRVSSATGGFYMVHPSSSNLELELYNTATDNEINSYYADNRSNDEKGYKHDFLSYTGFSDTGSSNDEYALRVINHGSQSVKFDIYQDIGNNVTFANKTSEKRTLTSPSTSSAAVAVGAVVANDTWVDSRGQSHTWLNDDQPGDLSYLSSQGPTVDGRTKPEVVAPGEAIVSATSSRAQYRPSTVVDNGTGSVTVTGNGNFEDIEGGWAVKSGTSMAAPHVAGQAALLIQKLRAVDAREPAPRTVKAALMQSGTDPQQPTHLQTTLNNRTGAGLINAQYGLATITLTDQTTGETDTVWLRYPDDGDRQRLDAHAAIQLNASGSSWEDEPQGVTVSLGKADSPFRYSRKAAVVNSSFQPGQTNALSVAGGNSRVDWAAATVLPPANDTILSSTVTTTGSARVSKTVHGYHRVSDAELDPGSAAAYAVPVDRSLGNGDFENRHGSVRAAAYWTKTTSDIDVRVEEPGGTVLGDDSARGSIPVAHAIGSSTPGSHKVIYTAHNASGSFNSTFASNYPLVPLPSSVDVTGTDLKAGNASNPNQIEFDVTIENANRPYSPKPYGQVDASHFTVYVGQKEVPSDQLTVTSPSPAPGEYHLKFTAPSQPRSGQFNLTVAVNDTKLNVSHTASTTDAKAVSYTGTGTGTSASVLIIDDSGSMSGTKMDDAKQAAIEYIALLSDQDEAAVTRYDSSATAAYSLSPVKGNRSAMRSNINNLNAGGTTDIGEGLNVGYTEITKADSGTPKAAILLSDGKHNGDFSPQQADDQYANANIPVYTIALGSGADESLLKDIANATGGEFKSAPTSANLSDIYADLSQTVTGASTIATTSGTVSAGNTANQTFKIDDSTSTAKVRTKLSSSRSSSSTSSQSSSTTSGPPVRLKYPNGTIVSMNHTGSGYEADPSNVEYTNIDNTHIYRVDDPDPGSWSTLIQNSQSSSVDYSTRVTGSTSATLSLITGSSKYVNGSKTTLTAQMVNQSGGISGASVTATVTYPDGSTRQVRLTEQSDGVYERDITNTDNGKMSVTVDATKGNVDRQKSTSWSVVDASSVLKTAPASASTPTGAEGSTIVAGVNLTLPSSSLTSTADGGATGKSATDDRQSDFQSAAQEVAASEPGTYNESAVDPAVQQAAEVLRNQTNGTTADVSNTIQATSSGSNTKQAYLQMGKLTGPSGATISSSNAQVNQSVVPLASGQTKTVGVRVSPPDGVTPAVYAGTLKVSISGTLLTHEVKVNVTEATAKTYRTRIRRSAKKWNNADSSGKDYYEKQIAHHLTELYFDSRSGGSSGGSSNADAQNSSNVSSPQQQASEDGSEAVAPRDTNRAGAEVAE